MLEKVGYLFQNTEYLMSERSRESVKMDHSSCKWFIQNDKGNHCSTKEWWPALVLKSSQQWEKMDFVTEKSLFWAKIQVVIRSSHPVPQPIHCTYSPKEDNKVCTDTIKRCPGKWSCLKGLQTHRHTLTHTHTTSTTTILLENSHLSRKGDWMQSEAS